MITFLILITGAVCVRAINLTAADSLTPLDDYLCRPWYSYRPTRKDCVRNEVYSSVYPKVRCRESGAIVAPGYCTTFEEDNGTFISACPYFQPHGLNFTHPGYTLPRNITELNDYMCGAMKMKNRLCSNCFDGFGPSFKTTGFQCSNCTGRWYGVPLYLLLDLGPTTILYLIVVIFHVSFTSAPMTELVTSCTAKTS